MTRFAAIIASTLALSTTIASAADLPITQAGPDSKTVRMLYPGTGWSTVLKDLAEAGGYELVMPTAPSGRFERFDTRPVPVEKAIRVVNSALSEQNLRVIARGKFLMVLEDETFRPVYPRFHYGTKEAGSGAATDARGPVTQMSATGPTNAIQSASFESTDRVEPLFNPAPIEMAEPARRQATVLEPQNTRAADLARRVVQSLGNSAELLDAGPLDLPAFQASSTDNNGAAIRWAVGVDTTANRLVIDAPQQHSEQLVQLFSELDESFGREPVTLAYAPPRVHAAAVGLAPVVNNMLAMQDEQPAGDAPVERQIDTPASKEDITRILDRLRSNVTVESLDELGLLILRGNEADVEAVMQIIDAIEKQSIGTTPEVHLRILADVDSSAMADLLNGVYEAVQSIETRPGRDDKRINVIPVVRPNAILIVAPSVELDSILDLVDNLDKPVDPATELRVYRLKYATATTAVETLTEFYEERGGLGTRVRASADSRTNSVIVQARPNDLREVDALLAKLDRVDGGSVSRVQIIPLKNAVATELADFLNAAIEDAIEPRQTGGARVGQGQQTNRSVVLEFMNAAGGKELLRSGVLEDVRISAEQRTNSIALMAPERSLPLLKALIESLDTPSAAAIEVKVFTLANADASAAVELLDELFQQDGTDEAVGVQLSGANDSASNLLPVRFSVDVRTNSIVATGGPDALTVVEAILLRLDASDARQRTTRVLKLKNSPAGDVADAINDFLDSQQELAASNPDLVSTVELINRQVIVVPEPISNNLLISATDDYFNEIASIANELDSAAQVIVQAMLVEVTLDNADEFGVELGFQDSVLFDRGLSTNTAITSAGEQTIISPVTEPGFRFNELQSFPNLGNVPTRPGVVGEQALSNFALGRVSELGFGGLVLSASSEAVSVLIRALAQNREVRVLSRPQIRTIDGQLAQIQVGQRVPIINGVTIAGTGVATPIIEYDESGLILDVTPRISRDGHILMEVIAERSAYDLNNGVPVFTDVNSGGSIESPIKDVTVARSTVSVANGQTIVLGGLITERDENLTRKVPWLGDIPILGRAFRYDQHSNTRTELLIFLTPRVIGTDVDNAVVKEVEAGRLHWFREKAEEVHGPIFDVEQPVFGNGVMPPPLDGDYCPPGVSFEGHPTELVSPTDINQFVPAPTPAPTPAGEMEVIR